MEELVSDVTLARLNEIFKSIMKKQVDKIDPIRSKFGKIEKEEVSLSDKMAYLENYCLTHSRFSFRSLLEAQAGKMEIIVTFLAILELMKTGKIFISQEHTFDAVSYTHLDVYKRQPLLCDQQSPARQPDRKNDRGSDHQPAAAEGEAAAAERCLRDGGIHRRPVVPRHQQRGVQAYD